MAHNNAAEGSDAVSNFRTLFVASAADEDVVRKRIESSLREGDGWSVLATSARPVSPSEQPLARRLATTPPSVER
jgi:hypothetical protein